ncbi:Permease [uncultured Gammaproteobacteria bacterium]
MQEFAVHGLDLFLDAAPWLVLGLAAAGLVHAWLPAATLGRWLGGRGIRPAVLAALIGAPLPLCSCGVLPAAVGLRRAGASREAVVSFLIATPETGLDSIALSYGILGPFFAIARPVAAVTSAVATGLLMLVLPREDVAVPALSPAASAGGCATDCCGSGKMVAPARQSLLGRTLAGLSYAFTDMFDDLILWLALGLLAAALTATLVPPQALAGWGGGLPAMLAMVAIGVPMYICATASTPLAGALLLAGVSPGAVMVFLLAGPATNLATIAVVRRELGSMATVLYLSGLIGCALVAGIITDLVVHDFSFDLAHSWSTAEEAAPGWVAMASAALLLALAIRSVWRRFGDRK